MAPIHSIFLRQWDVHSPSNLLILVQILIQSVHLHALKEKWNDFYHEIMVYPDPLAVTLKSRIAEREQISVDSILIGNGGAELITLVARYLTGKRILVIEPTFSEYETACRANQCEIQYHQLKGPDFSLNIEDLRTSLSKCGCLIFV